MREFLLERFPDLEVIEADGNTFLLYDPENRIPPERKFPLFTIVTNDLYDNHSRLDRPGGALRLNFPMNRETFRATFPDFSPETPLDYSVDDTPLPHPVYGGMNWACIVNPGPATLDQLEIWLRQAYDSAVAKYRSRSESP